MIRLRERWYRFWYLPKKKPFVDLDKWGGYTINPDNIFIDEVDNAKWIEMEGSDNGPNGDDYGVEDQDYHDWGIR